MVTTSIWSYILAILILVTVHEWGHYWVAKRCGVDIEKFSIGFGAPLISWTNKEGTVFCIAAIPLGGYVKMRGEFSIATDEDQTTQPKGSFAACNVWQRMAIVAAGPLVNLLFAMLIYIGFSYGTHQVVMPAAQAPAATSLAAPLGIQTGDVITRINQTDVSSWNDVGAGVSRALFDQKTIELQWRSVDGAQHVGQIDTKGISIEDPTWGEQIGLMPQDMQPKLDRVMPQSPAEMAGFQDGDIVTHINGQAIHGGSALRDAIMSSPDKYLALTVLRADKSLVIDVKPSGVEQKTKVSGTETTKKVGKMGVAIGGYKKQDVYVGPVDAFMRGVKGTVEATAMTFQGMYKIITGQLSTKNIGGPVAVAQMAGESTNGGIAGFLGFLAMLSVSLGALNLLPIPMLDGGHLVYYVIEVMTGKPVSEKVLAIGQKIGIAFLLCLMGLAFYNDALKLLG